MHEGEYLDCKMLSVIMRHLNILKYFHLESNLFGPELYSRLAGISLTMITEMF